MHCGSVTSIQLESPQRPYECPCGKSYRSYPALYVHIRNKHDGKAPDPIIKPVPEVKRKGRPPVKTVNKASSETTHEISAPTACTIEAENIDKQPIISAKDTNKLIRLLSSLPRQSIPRTKLASLKTLTQLSLFVVKGVVLRGQNLGSILVECFKSVTHSVAWSQFEQFATLITVFLQFISRKEHLTQVLAQKKADILCENINIFVEGGYFDLLEQYKLQQCKIFEKATMVAIFQALFEWLMVKSYTHYKITLDQSFRERNQY